MKKVILTVAVVVIGMAVNAGILSAEEGTAPAESAKEVKKQTICPVMGGAINKNVYVDHAGKRIYLCCGGCIGAVKADPEKYIKKLENEGITLEAVKTADEKKEEAKPAVEQEKGKETGVITEKDKKAQTGTAEKPVGCGGGCH